MDLAITQNIGMRLSRVPAGARKLCRARNPQLVCCKATCAHLHLTYAHRIGALLGDVVNAKESLLHGLPVQVIANLDGNAMIVGPRVHVQGLRQIRQILLPDPFEIGDIGASLLDELRHSLHRRYAGQTKWRRWAGDRRAWCCSLRIA